MSAKLKPVLVPKPEIDIEFDSWPRITPGPYRAYGRKASVYFDKRIRRWVCIVLFDVLNDSLQKVEGLAWFLNLGRGERPRAGNTSNYYAAWVKANDGKRPLRQDRMTPQIFTRRYCTIVVADTKKNCKQEAVSGEGCYSTITGIESWENYSCIDGSAGFQINQSTKSTNQQSLEVTRKKGNKIQTEDGNDLGRMATEYMQQQKENSRLEEERKARLDEEWRQTKIKRQLDA